MASGDGDNVRVVSRHMVRPEYSPTASSTLGLLETCILHLTPWDLRPITIDYIHKGVLLPSPLHTAGGPAPGQQHHAVVEHLASSLARALGRFYPFAGRLVVDDGGASTSPRPNLTVSLRCSDDGAEFVHATAPSVTVADVAAPLYTPRVVRSFFPLAGLLGADAVMGYSPVLAAQVTELADGVFVAMSLNHGVADGTTFWHFFNTWSEISRLHQSNGDNMGLMISTPSPVFERWFADGCPVPIPLPFGKLEDIVGERVKYLPVHECFLHFSSESVKKLKGDANAEVAGGTATISSLQAVLGHLWRAVCRARDLAPDQSTTYILLVGCRGRIDAVPAAYAGNATTHVAAEAAAGEILDKGLGWAALLLNRAVASFDEASVRKALASWPRNPTFSRLPTASHAHTTLCTGSSPRFDVYGNDFGWGRPVTVRSGPENKVDGKVTVYEGGGGGGSMALEVCLAPEVLMRLVSDEEFMAAVTTPMAS